MKGFEELKQKLLEGVSVEVGYDNVDVDCQPCFPDHGYYANTSYEAYYDKGKYCIYAWFHSNDGDCVDGYQLSFDTFDELVNWLNTKEFSISRMEVII